MKFSNSPYERPQHDDHCLIVVGGITWNIGSIDWPIIYVWRFYPTCAIASVDMSEFREDEYYEEWYYMNYGETIEGQLA